MKHCPRCERDLDVSEFGRCRDRPDGKNLYCKRCIREKMQIHRAAKRAYLERKPNRKTCKRSIPIWRMAISDKDKIRLAYARGITDRIQIWRETRVLIDDLTDIIAELYDAGVIKFNREQERFQIAA